MPCIKWSVHARLCALLAAPHRPAPLLASVEEEEINVLIGLVHAIDQLGHGVVRSLVQLPQLPAVCTEGALAKRGSS